MRITGVPLIAFEAITIHISATVYDGNIKVASTAHDGPGKPGCTAMLTVRDSHAYGARTTWQGRHGPYASWEAYRDVLWELFRQFPDATVWQGKFAIPGDVDRRPVVYKGRAGFLRDYPPTKYMNIGSLMNEVTMPELSIPRGGDHTVRQFLAELDVRQAGTWQQRVRQAAREAGIVMDPPEREHWRGPTATEIAGWHVRRIKPADLPAKEVAAWLDSPEGTAWSQLILDAGNGERSSPGRYSYESTEPEPPQDTSRFTPYWDGLTEPPERR